MQTLINPNTNNQQPISSPLRIIAIGDSLVYGYGDTEAGGWAERLRVKFMNGQSGHVLYNLGIRGDKTEQVQRRLQNEFNHRGEIRNKYPDVIIISVGVNDSPRLGHPQGRNLTSFDLFQSQVVELLKQAQELAPVFFVGMVPVDETNMPFLDCLYFNLRDQYHYKEATKQICQQQNVPYLDIFDLWMSRGENWRKQQMSDDGLHPNTKGYIHLYQEITQWQVISNITQAD